MKLLKEKFTKGISIFILSTFFITPVSAATAVKRDILINTNNILENKKHKTPSTVIIPNYVKQTAVKIGGYPYTPGKDIMKTNAIVTKRAPDGKAFKIIIDAKEFQNVHSLEVAGTRPYYNKKFDEYEGGKIYEWSNNLFETNGQEKEVVVSLSDLGIEDSGSNEMFDFYLTFLDRNGNELYSVLNLTMLFLNQNGPDTISNYISPRADRNISIELNGKDINSSVSPFQENGTTFVPIRVISENMGVKVNYNPKNMEIELIKGKDVIRLKVNSKDVLSNKGYTKLSSAPRLIDGTTFVPIRMIAENFNSYVQWDNVRHKVIIRDK